MESSMGSTIEKIKHQEHDKENKLREKRTIEATLASTSRCLRETTSRSLKLKEEFLETTARVDAANAELSIEIIRRDALTAQLKAYYEELQLLRTESDQGISKVWQLRNVLCDKVQMTADQCDVWALFTRPKYIESTTVAKKSHDETAKEDFQSEGVLKCALRKRQGLITERDRLLTEPDSGEEFIRIKNALQYSEQMAGLLRQ